MRTQTAIFGGSSFEDVPYDASVTNCTLQHGDVLVLATDGVFDNLFNQDILNAVTSRMISTEAWFADPNDGISISNRLDGLTRPGGLSRPLSSKIGPLSSPPRRSSMSGNSPAHQQTLQALLALTIAGQSKLRSMDLRRDGPFAKESQRYYRFNPWRGGKVDDICVVVVIAVEEGKEEP